MPLPREYLRVLCLVDGKHGIHGAARLKRGQLSATAYWAVLGMGVLAETCCRRWSTSEKAVRGEEARMRMIRGWSSPRTWISSVIT